jgi:hypothetical protein
MALNRPGGPHGSVRRGETPPLAGEKTCTSLLAMPGRTRSMVQDATSPFFTTAHFDGHPSGPRTERMPALI